MIQQADALGFTYSRRGCPCNGSPYIYTKEVAGAIYTLSIWPTRNAWRLTSNGCRLAGGDKKNMTTKIKEIWDL